MWNGLFHPYIFEESICYLRGFRCNFLGLFSSRQKLLLANSEDPDQMPHNAASDLGLHCLPMYPLLGFPDNNGLRILNLMLQETYNVDVCCIASTSQFLQLSIPYVLWVNKKRQLFIATYHTAQYWDSS